jgi:hypothetical protein
MNLIFFTKFDYRSVILPLVVVYVANIKHFPW